MHYFLSPDSSKASGGVRKIYQFVDTLNSHDIPAVVVHRQRGFRAQWFKNDTAVISAAGLTARGNDVIVLPEFQFGRYSQVFPSTRTILLAQNAFQIFRDTAPSAVDRLTKLPMARVVCVSPMNAGLVRRLLPHVPVSVITYSVDGQLFSPSVGGRTRTIAAMPRRRTLELTEVLAQLSASGALATWDLDLIDGVSEDEVAVRLGRASIFLSFSEREGLGLPPAEAMAAGCLVIGYDGWGGKDILSPERSFPVPEGDVVNYADVVTDVLRRWDDDDFSGLIDRGRAHILNTYTEKQQTADVLAAFDLEAPPLAGAVSLTPWATALTASTRVRTVVHYAKLAVAAARDVPGS